MFCVRDSQPACHQVEVAAEAQLRTLIMTLRWVGQNRRESLLASRLRASECSLAQRATSLCYLSISVSSIPTIRRYLLLYEKFLGFLAALKHPKYHPKIRLLLSSQEIP